MKALIALLAASGLLVLSQSSAEAQVSWGIPLPFPFLFYHFGPAAPMYPYYGGRRVYYGSGYSVPGQCTPSRHVLFNRPPYGRGYYYPPPGPRYDYGPRPGYWAPGWGGYGGW